MSARLSNPRHIVVFDLMECYRIVDKERVRSTLTDLIAEELQEAFDERERYPRVSLAIKLDQSVLVFTLHASIGQLRDADRLDVEYTIDIKTGLYTITEHEDGRIKNIDNERLRSLYEACHGTGYEDPGCEWVNGFTFEQIEAEMRARNLLDTKT